MSPLLLWLAAALAGPGDKAPPPSFVVFLTDDQRADSLWAMPAVRRELADEGVLFERAYVTCPQCAPTRASLLTGGFTPGHTGVLSNSPPAGGAARIQDEHTLATRLQQRGYATALLGKYANGYEDIAPRVPPGWTRFEAVRGFRSWTDLDVVTGSSTTSPTEGEVVQWDRYVTVEQTASALDFLDAQHHQPFLLVLSYMAPHHPAQPHPDDVGTHADYTFRGEAFDEADVSDKPPWIQALPRLDEPTIADLDLAVQQHLDSLVAVDRSVDAVLQHLDELGVADHTAVFFLSDNGLAWGEHRMVRIKGAPYEESARVPLVVRMPGVDARRDASLVAAELDVPATLLDLAGDTGATDGLSLAPLLHGTTAHHREQVRLQVWEASDRPAWVGAVAPSWKASLLASGETELYLRAEDPWELDSQHAAADQAERMVQVQELLLGEAELSILDRVLPTATEGRPYEEALRCWGGEAPLRWSALEDVPAGLALSEDGVLSGTPLEAGTSRVLVQVADSSTSPQHGGPQVHRRWLSLEVLPADSGDTGPADTGIEEEPGCGCAQAGGSGGWGLLLLLLAQYLPSRRREAATSAS